MENNALFDHSILRRRYQEYLREVAQDQLIREVKNAQPKAHARLLNSLSNLLIGAGQWLQNRSQSPSVAPVSRAK